MARHSLLFVCVAALLAFAAGFSSEDIDAIVGELDSVIRNDEFMITMVKVGLQNQLYGAQQVEIEQSSSPEETACVREATRQAIKNIDAFVKETVGSILADLLDLRSKVDKEPSQETYTKVQEYLAKLNYPQWKKEMMKTVKEKMSEWVPKQQLVIHSCVKK